MTQRINRIEIDLVPLKLFSRRISEGWTMVPGYPLKPGDYVVTMMPPNFPEPRSNASWRQLTAPHKPRETIYAGPTLE
jgi:hypothetical protein